MRVLIVDDEPFIRDELKYFLTKIEGVDIVGETGYGDEVIDLVKSLKPDMVFLDIELQYTNGISIARSMTELENKPMIVFATAYDKYAVLGYELDVVDYILKPFSQVRIQQTVDKASARLAISSTQDTKEKTESANSVNRIGKLCVSHNDRLYLKALDEIVFFEANKKNVRVVCKEGEYASQYALKDLESILEGTNFFRVHKSFIVNLQLIEEIVPWFNYTFKLKMQGRDDEIIVNRSYMKTFKAMLKI